MRINLFIACFMSGAAFYGCSKKSSGPPPPLPPPVNFNLSSWSVNNVPSQNNYYDAGRSPVIKFNFLAAIDRNSVSANIALKENSGSPLFYNVAYENGDSTVIITPPGQLLSLTRFRVSVADQLKSKSGGKLVNATEISFITSIDSSDKYPVIADDDLLTLVQQQTFRYFWDFAHPVSGLIRERNTSGDIVTSGGSGFGIMAIITGVKRNFIVREQALTRMQTIVSFLKNTAQKFHGAFPHWMNGATGAVVPFSTKDNGADIVETSYLMMGLLCARQYFNGADATETALRNDINTIWNAVEWDWFRKNNENVLYWHWSPNYNWEMNLPVTGWNEALITYVLAASSTTHAVPKIVYDNGWAKNGAIRNNNMYYGINLPLGEPLGGPLFFSHYSFLGINPNGLSDQYANYQEQVANHSKINYEYCKANPKNYYGYSQLCWGLTASDIQNGYTASSPTNDIGVIAPTAAVSSLPFTPAASMQALNFFYYKLGDKIWKQYGFVDAFALKDTWFADSFLAIDQGPIIIMIENYRSGLLWNLFTSCPEVKAGMLSLGFSAPYL
jgi:hypothetical protein